MKILVDAREAVRNKSGIGVVAKELIKQFMKSNEPDIKFIILQPSDKRFFNSKAGRLFEYLWWKSFYTYYIYKKNKCDYLFSLDPIGNLFINKNISIVHDLIFFVNPLWTNVWGKLWRFLLPKNINSNKLIFTPSLSTSEDIVKYLTSFNKNIPIKELHWGFNKNIFNTKSNKNALDRFKELDLDMPYIFFLGNNEPRRNLSKVVIALGRYLKKNNNKRINLYIGGNNSDNEKNEIYNIAKKYKIQDNVIFLGYLDDVELAEFYRQALLYIYPSMYEGFGLTVIEAMACGCPVITSNNSSLKDIAGNAALLVDPFSQDDITSKLANLLDNESLKNDYVKLGLENIKKYNWDLVYKDIIENIRRINK
jgi:glycosyltransferase involved in cell wall biosynthesis